MWCSGDDIKSDSLATLDCFVVSFVRKTTGIFEKKTGRTFENRFVFTKIIKFIYLVSHDFFILYVVVNDQLFFCLLVGVR